MRKVVSIFTMFVFLLLSSNIIAFAAGVRQDTNGYDNLKYGEDLRVANDNTIYITSYDQIATTNIRYRTLGFTVRNENKTKSVIVRLQNVRTITHADDPINVEQGRMVSIYKVASGELYEQVGKAYPEWLEELSKGQTVYLDSVMTIYQYGTMRGKLEYDGNKFVGSGEVYYDLQGIKKARGWKDPDSLDTHFNKRVYLPPLKTDIGFIDADLTATANPGKIQQGVMGSVDVTLNSSGSRAKLMRLGSKMEDVKITSRRYWVTGAANEGIAQEGDTITIHVDNVTSSTVLTCRVRVYSQELADMNNENILPYDEATVNIYLGQQGIASANCDLNADHRGNEKFNVLQGIPTTESLYANISTEKYIADFEYENVTGQNEYTVSVSRTYNLEWEENGQTRRDTQLVTQQYTVTREYSFHTITSLGVYSIDRAVIKNACLPTGSVTILPTGYVPPKVEVWHSEDLAQHIKEPVYSSVILPARTIKGGAAGRPSVPKQDWSAEAEKAVGPIEVKNDKLVIDGHNILNGDVWYSTDSSDPQGLTEIEKVGKNVLYKNNIVIDAKTLNGEYNSTGTIYYRLMDGSINAGADVREAPIDVNPVIVHTPVVCDPTITNDSAHNQEIKPDNTRTAMILGRTTQLSFPTIGKYINKKGYVGADYRKYTQDRIVVFPFDVYIKGEFYKAGKEYHMPAGVDTIDIKLPTWVDEGNYGVECRSIAINSPGNANLKQDLANISYSNYIATKTIQVRVIGRIYGLKITDINDYPDWAQVFRTDTKSTKHSNNYYWVGNLNEEGQARGNTDKFTFPILNGSHSEKSNLGVLKTGYKIRFDLTTIGNYFKDADCVRIKPKFYFVKKDGSGRQEVDLWYTEKINGVDNLIKVGSKTDANNIKSIVLGDPYRNVPDEELANTSKIIGMTKNEFSNQKAKIGAYGDVVLSKPLRTFIGDTSNVPDGVNVNRVKESVQKWYGEYSIPNNVYVCKKDLDVVSSMGKAGFTGKEKFWIKNGYIIVNFEIETIKNGDGANPQLSYWNNPNCNMWKLEGFNYTKKDSSGANFTLRDGDIIFYYTDKKSSDDYSSGGTN